MVPTNTLLRLGLESTKWLTVLHQTPHDDNHSEKIPGQSGIGLGLEFLSKVYFNISVEAGPEGGVEERKTRSGGTSTAAHEGDKGLLFQLTL